MGYIVIRDRCGMNEDVATTTEMVTFQWFGHIERMDDNNVTHFIEGTRKEKWGKVDLNVSRRL